MEAKREEKSKADLSLNDRAVLNRVFNPNLPYSEVVEEEADESELESEESPEVKQAKELEIQAVNAAEKGDLPTAMDLLNQAIVVAPNRASCYNNRAQALRLKGDTQGAFEDIEKAIELSDGKGKAACQAFTQRGLIHRLQGDEEAALEDFKRAACLGGIFAKQQVVTMNPYAALCNQMLGEVMRKLRTGET